MRRTLPSRVTGVCPDGSLVGYGARAQRRCTAISTTEAPTATWSSDVKVYNGSLDTDKDGSAMDPRPGPSDLHGGRRHQHRDSVLGREAGQAAGLPRAGRGPRPRHRRPFRDQEDPYRGATAGRSGATASGSPSWGAADEVATAGLDREVRTTDPYDGEPLRPRSTRSAAPTHSGNTPELASLL